MVFLAREIAVMCFIEKHTACQPEQANNVPWTLSGIGSLLKKLWGKFSSVTVDEASCDETILRRG